MKPFGEPACESEVRLGQYQQRFFEETEFNQEALRTETYIVVGRRGSGKTALAQYFDFQRAIPNAISIHVNEAEAFLIAVGAACNASAQPREVNIPRLMAIWEFMIWGVIFGQLEDEDKVIERAYRSMRLSKSRSALVSTVVGLARRFLASKASDLSRVPLPRGDAEAIEEGKEAVLEIAADQPLIVACDTLEHYDIHNEGMMQATAALVQASCAMNETLAPRNVHIKAFVSGEVFPHLKESVIQNTLKYVHDPVFLRWRPKDLLRLISWRLQKYLEQTEYKAKYGVVMKDWSSYNDVLEQAWEPYFGKTLRNSNAIGEATFPYLLRHTQMRPRQLIVLCNVVAEHSIANQRFPIFSPEDIVLGVAEGERELATEVINSYSEIYPQAGAVLEALMGIPALFDGKELDRRAKVSAGAWPANEYSLGRFRQLVAELGIVGRVRKKSGHHVGADFEYAWPDRLALQSDDPCVIHPMFFRKLNVRMTPPIIVHPFPDAPDYKTILE